MNKRFLKATLFAAMCVSLPASFTSCCDYDDDIKDLQGQIDAVKADVQKLQELVDKGYVITNVASTANGVQFTMSNGQTYEITNGKEGKAGDTWTIGEDGYWYQNGKKTDYRAIGPKGEKGDKGDKGDQGDKGDKGDKGETGATGATGATGPQGPAGSTTDGTPVKGDDGKDGGYYKPNQETGMFDLYDADGNLVSNETGISWRNSDGITAVYTGTKLVLSGVKDAEGNDSAVEINMGAAVGSIAFIPSVLSNVGGYPTTDEPFYHIPTYYDAKFEKQPWDLSNVVDLEFRVNPQDAYIADQTFGNFVNRVVVSRAAGDYRDLMVCDGLTINNGEINAKALYNVSYATEEGNDVAAFQFWNGQEVFTSDYIAPASSPVDVCIIRKDLYEKDRVDVESVYPFKARTRVVTPENVKYDMPLDYEDGILTVAYNDEGVDLNDYVDLYSEELGARLSDVNFKEATYKYQLVEYIGADGKTDMQTFAKLDGSHFSVNKETLTGGLTPADLRTPVILVDAYMQPNDKAAEPQIVASAYIKVRFVERTTDLEDVVINLADKTYKYSELSDEWTLVNDQFSWLDVNNQIYGASGLSATTFWSYFGGNNDVYNLRLSVLTEEGEELLMNKEYCWAKWDEHVWNYDNRRNFFKSQISSNSEATSTSVINFSINNAIKTDATEGLVNVDGKGAEYTVTLRIPSDNKRVKGDVVLVQKFYVLNDYTPYEANSAYLMTAETEAAGHYVFQAKNVTAEGIVQQVNIAELFKIIDAKNIFEYYADPELYGNVDEQPEIAFNFEPSSLRNFYMTEEHDVKITMPIAVESMTANMNYEVELKNGELMVYPFDIIFTNQFKAAEVAKQTITDAPVGNTINVAEFVKVLERKESGKDILVWDKTKKSLDVQAQGKNYYKLANEDVHVEYAWSQEEGDFAGFVGTITAESTFTGRDGEAMEADPNLGELKVSFINQGAKLQKTYNLVMNATVTFSDLSQVVVKIPVQVAPEK